MATDKQIAANRLNAAKSTGPTTPQGLARSAQNAYKHGLRGRLFVVPSEDVISGYVCTTSSSITTGQWVWMRSNWS
jgi:hypothetical protein